MKNLYLSLLTLSSLCLVSPVQAADLMVAKGTQSCQSNADCTLVTNNCADNCAFVPVNTTNLGQAQALYQSSCGKTMDANPVCSMTPPLHAACINARCTIDYAYKNNADAKDYKSGAYPVPEKATPSTVKGDYSNVDDKKGGFNAYDLPQDSVKQNTVGQIVDRVYVPPSAPVSGENYVPVGSAAPVQTKQAAPNATTQNPYKDELYAPDSDTQPQIPSPGLPNAPRAAPVAGEPTAPIPQVGATGVPQASPGSTPIPPSDLKPAPTFLPPAGTASPVSQEDPGAPPPAGTSMSIMPETAEEAAEMKQAQDATTSFARTKDKKSGYGLNN